MKESKDVFQAIEGIDEDGVVKAICCLMIEKRFEDMRQTPEVHKLAYLQDASVRVNLMSDFAVVDLSFESYIDYDYRQALELCMEFTTLTDSCRLEEKPDSDPSLILSITPKEKCDFFLMGTDAVWSFTPEKPEGMCNAIRLIFVREKFATYEFERRQ